MRISQNAPRGRSLLVGGTLTAALFAGIVGCNPGNALKIPQPDNLSSATLNSAAALPALLAGTFSAFQIAYSGAADEGNGGHEGFINFTGLFTDELSDEETFPTRILVDERVASASNASLKGYYIDINEARALADKADAKYNQFGTDSTGHDQVLALGGFTYVMLAEAYCEGVPISTLNDNGSITYGQPLTRPQVLAIAIQRFDSAETFAKNAGDSATLNLARVGLGRAFVDSGDFADAVAAVTPVPVTYSDVIGASTNSAVENNGIWTYSFNELGFAVSDKEGTNGLPFVSANDPRVPTFNITDSPGPDSGEVGTSGLGCPAACIAFIQQQLYPTQSTPIPLASGTEAQLIIAEADLKGGNVAGWTGILNSLRASAGIAALTPDSTTLASPDMQLSVMFRERAFWMFLTGHRLGDLRRLIRQYGRDVSVVFPVGKAINGVPYGSDVNFDISEDEANNPNFHGCLNRKA
jgi:hypothetical protein